MSYKTLSQFQPRLSFRQRWPVLAIGVTAGALAAPLQLLAKSRLGGYEILLGVVSMVVIALGTGSGLLALFVSTVITFVATPSRGPLIGFLPFVAIGVLICWIGGRLYRDRQNLAAVLGCIDEAIVIVDRNAHIQFMNPIAEAVTGWTAKEAVSKDAGAIMPLKHAESRRNLEHAFEQVIQHCLHVSFDRHTLLLSKEGVEAPIEGSGSPIPDRGGRTKGMVMVFRDITARRLEEQERSALIRELQDDLAKTRLLRGLLPICAWCERIRNEVGCWRPWEQYIREHSEAEFTHGFCPECVCKFDPQAAA